MEKTNEKKDKRKSSFFSRITSKEKEANKTTKVTKVQEKRQSKNIKSYITLSPEDLKKELDSVVKSNKKTQIVEYYDLPYRYNQTVIKILAQTPHSIFIYWDLSDFDRAEMIKKYGENLFYETKPILLVHNETLNYSFEIEIDDFTNSWYLRTPTSNCVFNIELGRKKIPNYGNIKIDSQDNILHITSSNTIESPNDHVLKDTLTQTIYFKNIKTNEIEERKVSNLKAIQNLYNIFEFYGEDEFEQNPSSSFKI